MLTSDDLTTPDWTLVITIGGSELRTTIHDADRLLPGGIVPAGARIWVEGTTDKDGDLYVVQIGDAVVAVLSPGDGSADFVDAGVAMRLPAGNDSFLTPIDGRIRVVESPEPVPVDDWWKLLHGRDPRQQGTTILNSVKVADASTSTKKPNKSTTVS
jgi:hypothetical protein